MPALSWKYCAPLDPPRASTPTCCSSTVNSALMRRLSRTYTHLARPSVVPTTSGRRRRPLYPTPPSSLCASVCIQYSIERLSCRASQMFVSLRFSDAYERAEPVVNLRPVDQDDVAIEKTLGEVLAGEYAPVVPEVGAVTPGEEGFFVEDRAVAGL